MTAPVDPLLHAFPPELVRFGSTLRPSAPEAVPLPELLRPASLAALADSYGASLSSTDRRAVLSMWSQFYMLVLLPPVVATALVSSRQPEVALPASGVVLSPDGAPLAVCVPDLARAASTACPAARLTPLLRTHLEPLVAGLATAGLPPVVVWSNAGHVVSWALRTILAPAERLALLSASLQDPVWVDGGPNPLHQAVRRGGRSVCCLRHRLPGSSRCGNCPVGARACHLRQGLEGR